MNSDALNILEEMRLAVGETRGPAPLESSPKAFPVLVSTIISLRTRDAVTRKVSEAVLGEAGNVDSMDRIEEEELQELLKPAGFYRQKASQLKRIARILKEDSNGEVPKEMDSLLSLPGVGRKTANFVLGMVFGEPSICVDVHVHRISNRLGIVNTNTPEETEFALREVFPREEWIGINHTMVRFGQTVCRPRNPLCNECSLKELCPSAGG
ncbi:MAG: endonuclease III [Candidatus Aegiribacteria sp.]|nr:endonuclease III [Candidatus Aegiribacteria sp.]MBD3294306.1 endonuclease III [Candidatus Fermentibacteria bacterium]